MNNIKLLIQNAITNISFCDENIKEEKNKIQAYRKTIKMAYASCDHDFKEVPSMGASIVECKICGYKDGK